MLSKEPPRKGLKSRKRPATTVATSTHQAKIPSLSTNITEGIIIIDDDKEIKTEKINDEVNAFGFLNKDCTMEQEMSVRAATNVIVDPKTPKNRNILAIQQSSDARSSNSSPSVFENINARLIYSSLNIPNTPQQGPKTVFDLKKVNQTLPVAKNANEAQCTPPLTEQMDTEENLSSHFQRVNVNTRAASNSEDSQCSRDNYLDYLLSEPSSNMVDRGVQCTLPRTAEVGVNTMLFSETDTRLRDYLFQHDFLYLLSNRLALSPTHLYEVITDVASNYYEFEQNYEPNDGVINYQLCSTPDAPISNEISNIVGDPVVYNPEIDLYGNQSLENNLESILSSLNDDVDLFNDGVDFNEKDGTSSDYSEVSGSPKANSPSKYNSMQLRLN